MKEQAHKSAVLAAIQNTGLYITVQLTAISSGEEFRVVSVSSRDVVPVAGPPTCTETNAPALLVLRRLPSANRDSLEVDKSKNSTPNRQQ